MTPANSESFEVPYNQLSVRSQLKAVVKLMHKAGWRFYKNSHGHRAVCSSGYCQFQLNSSPRNPDLDNIRARKKLGDCTHLAEEDQPNALRKGLRKLRGR